MEEKKEEGGERGSVKEEVKELLKTSDTNDVFLIKNFNLAN